MKRIFLLLSVIGCFTFATAQEQPDTTNKKNPAQSLENNTPLRHYIEVAGQAGVASFVGDPRQGYFSPSYNAGLGFFYVMRSLPYHVGMRTGLAAESSQSRFRTSEGYADIFSTTDGEGQPLDVTYNIGSLSEVHTQVYFTIPLQFSVFGENLAFHIGPKVAIALADFSEQTLYQTTMSAKYPLSGVVVNNDAKLAMGYQEQQTLSVRHDKILPRIWAMVSAELTYDVPFGNKYAICFGLYADYALNHFTVAKSNNPSLLYVTPIEEGSTQLTRMSDSVLRAEYNGKQNVDRFGYFAAGLKVAFKMWD